MIVCIHLNDGVRRRPTRIKWNIVSNSVYLQRTHKGTVTDVVFTSAKWLNVFSPPVCLHRPRTAAQEYSKHSTQAVYASIKWRDQGHIRGGNITQSVIQIGHRGPLSLSPLETRFQSVCVSFGLSVSEPEKRLWVEVKRSVKSTASCGVCCSIWDWRKYSVCGVPMDHQSFYVFIPCQSDFQWSLIYVGWSGGHNLFLSLF